MAVTLLFSVIIKDGWRCTFTPREGPRSMPFVTVDKLRHPFEDERYTPNKGSALYLHWAPSVRVHRHVKSSPVQPLSVTSKHGCLERISCPSPPPARLLRSFSDAPHAKKRSSRSVGRCPRFLAECRRRFLSNEDRSSFITTAATADGDVY